MRQALTACWSKSKTGKKHPYYMCYNKGCSSRGRSIRRDKLEGHFEATLYAMQPSDNLHELARAMFKDAWNQRMAQGQNALTSLKTALTKNR